MNTVGKHVELFLVEGVAGGITTAEVVGWTGHVLTGVRADFSKKVVKRQEAERNGVYILIGDDPDAVGGLMCYIGKTENFKDRFSQHLVKKDFWDRFVLISAKDAAFNEGHWSHLEHRLIGMAHKAKRAKVDNDRRPKVRKLSEAAVSDVEAFIEQLQFLLPVLGVNFFKSRETATDQEKKESSPIFELSTAGVGSAKAELRGGEFVVLEGSQCATNWDLTNKSEATARSYARYAEILQKFIDDGSVRIFRDGVGVLTRDVPFASPSTAAALMKARSANGRVEWKTGNQTLSQWEDEGMREAASESASQETF